MKLAFCLFKYFRYGGLERDFLRIAMACHERGHDITVFTQQWHGTPPTDFNVNVLPLRSFTSHGKCREFARLTGNYLHHGNFDAAIGFNKMPGLDFYFAADPCYQHRIRETHGPLYRLSPRYRTFLKLEEAVFSQHAGTEILLLAAPQQAVFQHYYQTPPERFHLLPPGISRDRSAPANAAQIRAEFRREFAIGDDENLLLMIGSGFKRKGLDRALRALASLPEPILKKTRLIVVGEDNPNPYLRMAKRLGVSDRLRLTGGRDDVPRFLLGADLFIHPAYSEAGGMVLLESICSGLPLLVTEVCGYAFHVVAADAGCVASSPFKQAELNQLLHDMLTSPNKHQWHLNALHYATTTDLYSLSARVVDLIEAKVCTVTG
ncbi:MAG: glycosyltransferase family 4 protein [Gammaproteobacteria bacterium]